MKSPCPWFCLTDCTLLLITLAFVVIEKGADREEVVSYRTQTGRKSIVLGQKQYNKTCWIR